MKKEKFLKVGLSVLCTAVLAACGGSDDDTPSPTNTPTPTATTTPTATPTSMPTPSAIPTTQAGAQLTEAERAARAEQLSEEKNSYVAMQHAKKINSDVDETTGTPTSNATLQRVSQTKLVPALDTIVVAVPSNDQGKVTYLEDFQFNNVVVGSTVTAQKVKHAISDIPSIPAADADKVPTALSAAKLNKNFDIATTGDVNNLLAKINNSLSTTELLTTPDKIRDAINKIKNQLADYANNQNIVDPLGKEYAGRLRDSIEAFNAAKLSNDATDGYGGDNSSGTYKTLLKTNNERDVLTKILASTDPTASGEKASDIVTHAKSLTQANFAKELNGEAGLNGYELNYKQISSNGFKQLVEAEIARGNKVNNEKYINSRKEGTTKLSHIYLSPEDRSTDTDLSAGTARVSTAKAGGGSDSTYTETDTQGRREGTALVYQAGRRVYITKETNAAAAPNYVRTSDVAGTSHQYNGDGTTLAKGDGKTNTAGLSDDRNKVRSLEDSVAEVYGNKTFTYEIGKTNANYTDNFANDGGNNAPFTGNLNKKTGYYDSKELKHVQYGRVTSAISGLQPSDLRKGVVDKTVVGIYGKYGQDGTENTYFARGNNRTSNADIAKLSGNLTYSGHAVSYGLDNSFNQIAAVPQGQIPNAIGAQAASSGYQLWSGNHVEATIDTSKKTVSGAISNIWSDGKTETNGNLNIKRVDLVKFNGDFGANGNMIGTSEIVTSDTGTNKSAALNKNLTDEERKGTFHAALFGSNGEEMAGNVKSSSNEAEKAWGAAFGAAQVQGSPWATQISQ